MSNENAVFENNVVSFKSIFMKDELLNALETNVVGLIFGEEDKVYNFITRNVEFIYHFCENNYIDYDEYELDDEIDLMNSESGYVFSLLNRKFIRFDFSLFDGDAYSVLSLNSPSNNVEKTTDAYIYMGAYTGCIVLTKSMYENIKDVESSKIFKYEKEGGLLFEAVIGTRNEHSEEILEGIYLIKE